ncbi:hypothetical protein K438DRAFT_1979577 [Mycena galopus ATCC 62051]|nr:hypothetical protein K438DRAFT_1979577 [Mycena galopus ATCC 62051]
MATPPPSYALLPEMAGHSALTQNNTTDVPDTDTDSSMPGLIGPSDEEDNGASPSVLANTVESTQAPAGKLRICPSTYSLLIIGHSFPPGLTHAAVTTLIQNIGSLNISGHATNDIQPDRHTPVIGDLNAPSNNVREPTMGGEARVASQAIRHAIWESIIDEAERSQRHAHARYGFSYRGNNHHDYQRRPNGHRFAIMVERLDRMEMTLRRIERLVRARARHPISGRR